MNGEERTSCFDKNQRRMIGSFVDRVRAGDEDVADEKFEEIQGAMP